MTQDSTSSSAVIYRVRVAVPVMLYDCFDYTLTAAQYVQAEVGSRVAVSFGRQNLVGVIVEKIAPETPVDDRFRLKDIQSLLDKHTLLDNQVLNLLHWSAQYYQFPLGEVIQAALPTALRQGKPYELLEKRWRITKLDGEEKTRKAAKQLQAFQFLQQHLTGISEQRLHVAGIENSTLKALEKKGLIQSFMAKQDFRPLPVQLAEAALIPNAEQQHAIDTVVAAQNRYQAFLLDGLTGSGKTEVYLHIMHEVLQQGKQVLVLVPEIGLTPQTIQRFQSRFQCHIALLHSGLNETKRLVAWQAAQTGQAAIILGTRSAIYTPLPNLGLIILDEEHDLSYKQQEGFRYHARDVALYRAYLAQCPVLLGSATPSIESYALVDQGKMQYLQLSQRAGNASMPAIHVLDLKIAAKQQGISQLLLTEMKRRLKRNEQVLVFLNRRGYAPVLICESCAWQAKCPHCDANFTVHRDPYQHLHCHHCGTIHRLPTQCPACNQQELKALGMATAKVEEQLNELFPEFDVIRVDRDSTSRVGSWQKIYEKIHQAEPVILLGTQMLAKGHHFPYVTLVAILDIDSGLLSVDFRATERTAQLVTQVAGRAGRGEKKGDVFLQTLRPEHPLLSILVNEDYRAFAQQTLKDRKLALMPPFRYAALIRCESRDQTINQNFLTEHAQFLRENSEQLIDIWGPIPAPMERKAGRYQAHMVLLSHDRARLHYYIRPWWQNMLQQKPAHMKLTLDIDPQELS